LSQRAHIQYTLVLLMKGAATMTANAQGITVIAMKSMCRTARRKLTIFMGGQVR
jgi:hypothetical protein